MLISIVLNKAGVEVAWGITGEAQEVAQTVKSLLLKHEDLSSIPSVCIKSQHDSGQPVIPELGRTKQKDSWDLLAIQPSRISEHRLNERPHPKIQDRG